MSAPVRGVVRASRAACAWVAIAFAAVAAAAPVELEYGREPAQRLTVHAVDARAAQPVVMHFGARDPTLALLLVQHGYVLVDVETGDGERALGDAAAALAFVAQGIAAYGGDPERLHLVGDGADAALVERVASSDLDVLTQRRVRPAALRSVVLRGAHRYGVDRGRAGAPTLFVHARADAARRDAERYAAKLRERGTPAQVLAVAGDARAARGELAAFLDTVAIARVARYEQLDFAYRGDVPASLGSLLALDGVLYGGAAAAARVLKREAPESRFALEHDFGDDYAEVLALAALGPTPCAVLRGADAGVALACRGDDGWGEPRRLPLRASKRVAVLAGDDASLLVASDTRIARAGPGTEPRLELEANAIVAALARVDGVAHAALAGPDAALLRHDPRSGRWPRVASLTAHALAGVPDPQGSGREVLLVATADGVDRLDPARDYEAERELDFERAFSATLGARATLDRGASAGFVALPHPETHDLVHVLAIALSPPDRELRGAYYLVRQLDGSYAYGIARDFAAARDEEPPARLVALAPSPYGDGGVWTLGRERGGGTVLAVGALARHGAREGLWWDRTRPGHGLALHPAGDDWLAMLYTYDERGAPLWYLAVGTLADGRFVPDSNGLARYRLAGDAKQPARDVERSGSIEIRFAGAAASEACRAAPRTGAVALAVLAVELGGRTIESCVEPISYGPRGLPSIDPTGVWHAGPADRSFGIALVPQGYEGATREAALVYYYDADGEPRWALGAGDSADGAASIELASFRAACLGCDPAPLSSRRAGTLSHRMRGFCGAVAGSATLALEYPGRAGGQLARRNVALERLSSARCY